MPRSCLIGPLVLSMMRRQLETDTSNGKGGIPGASRIISLRLLVKSAHFCKLPLDKRAFGRNLHVTWGTREFRLYFTFYTGTGTVLEAGRVPEIDLDSSTGTGTLDLCYFTPKPRRPQQFSRRPDHSSLQFLALRCCCHLFWS